MVERAGMHADKRLPGTDLWLGHFFDLDLGCVSALVEEGGFHGKSFLLEENLDSINKEIQLKFGRSGLFF
jgi:hypothetical protein